MKKIFVITYDDGTVHDIDMIKMLNGLGIRATFNLNSRLADYVWFSQGKAIRRLDLPNHVHLYDGHEVAGHTETHPNLDALTDEQIAQEVGNDQRTLSALFGYPVTAFAAPFGLCSERVVETIRKLGTIRCIRLYERDHSFAFPEDPYHVKPTACHADSDLMPLTAAFLERKVDSLFVLAGHSYEFYLDGNLEWFQEYLKGVQSHPEVEFMTISEAMASIFGGK